MTFREEEVTNHADHNSNINVGSIYQSLQTTKQCSYKDSTDKNWYMRVTNHFLVSNVNVHIKLQVLLTSDKVTVKVKT